MNNLQPDFSRALERSGSLPLTTKVYQAIGALPGAFKDFAFSTFLLLFYSKVLGMSAGLASTAIMLALVVDAITDPLVGSYSDGLKTKWGRRHPLMYAAAVPLGISLYLVFTPPAGLEENGQFVWLLSTAVATRIAMTFFGLPWAALFPELTDDYAERSEVLTYRFLVGAVGGVLFTWCIWSFVFPSSPQYTPGHLNPDGYWLFAVLLGLVTTVTALVSTALTHREIPYLNQPIEANRFQAKKAFYDILGALENRDFLILFGGLLLSSVITGTLGALDIYIKTYFWGLTPEDLRWFAIGGLGLIAAFVCIPWFQSRFDKKHLLVGSMLFSLINGMTFICLRLLDVLPPNGDPLLIKILIVDTVLSVFSGSITLVMFVSMVADTLDAQELNTGKRQEGVFSAAISFSTKVISGVGIFAAGMILEHAIGFPQDAHPGELSEELIFRFGVVAGLVVPAVYLLPFWIATKYRISRARYAEIQEALATRRNKINEDVVSA